MKQPTDKWIKRTKMEGPLGEYQESHPSYGIIGINRVSGNSHLFGSEVRHMHYLSLTISEATRFVDPPREFLSADRELIRISMTDSQFAEMITSPNQGQGVACTIERCIADKGELWLNHFGGRPDPPEPEPYTQRYKDAMGERANTVIEHIKKAKVMIDELTDGDTRPTKTNLKALQDALYMAEMNVEKNLPYVMNEMEEGIEKRMATAINEFESYVAFSLQSKGLEGLAAEAPRLAVGEQKALPEETK
jgi:hypothetical protein